MAWATKYRYDVLVGELQLRIREIIRQICAELDIEIIKGVLWRDHNHMFLPISSQHSDSDVMGRIKGRYSRKIQQDFPSIRNRYYWGHHLWARGCFSTTVENINYDTTLQYLAGHIEATGVSR